VKNIIALVFAVAAWAIALCLSCSSCKETLPPEPPYVVFPPYQDASVDAELDVDPLCRLACESLAKMGCPESAPAGRTCGSVCTAAEQQGIDLPTICIANASTPDQVRACGMVRCQGR
jgi:hypothetical protein